MRSVEDAIATILAEVTPRPATTTPLDAAHGLVLAEAVISDVDSPPFDKSQMDGFAVRSEEIGPESATLTVVETVTAGKTPTQPLRSGQATHIMTGAPVPEGADAVVPIEQTTPTGDDDAVIVRGPVSPGSYVIRRGTSIASGDEVLPVGAGLNAPQLGLLAELGQTSVRVFARPLVGILATGDELVPITDTPGPGQIRNSNQTMLMAQLRAAGAAIWPLGIARDERVHLDAKIAAGLVCDILCLSGGVSAGQLDLVPAALQAAGVREVFHKVDMKPGKPVWFGRLDADRAADGRDRWIFGLPGNPVSSMVCCELFVRTAVRRLMGTTPAEPQPIDARLEVEHAARGDRPTYFPARLRWTADGPTVRPVDWRGSFDLRATADGNAMVLFAGGTRTWAAGEQVPVYEW